MIWKWRMPNFFLTCCYLSLSAIEPLKHFTKKSVYYTLYLLHKLNLPQLIHLLNLKHLLVRTSCRADRVLAWTLKLKGVMYHSKFNAYWKIRLNASSKNIQFWVSVHFSAAKFMRCPKKIGKIRTESFTILSSDHHKNLYYIGQGIRYSYRSFPTVSLQF